MTLPLPDNNRHWTRELAEIRKRGVKFGLNRPGVEPALGPVLEQALSACTALMDEVKQAHIESEQLRQQLDNQISAYARLFELLPVPCLTTNVSGVIVSANRAAALLLNVSARHLADRRLLYFSEDRGAFTALVQSLSFERIQHRASIGIRPRDRAPVDMDAIVVPQTATDAGAWLWFFVPCAEPERAAAPYPTAS